MLKPKKIESDVFFATHPVFTAKEFDSFLAMRSGVEVVSAEARQTLLRHHLKQQKILRVRRGLYASVPVGQNPDSYPVDPYLMAAHLTEDSILAYHTALSLHGIAQSIWEETTTLSIETASTSFSFRGVLYRTLPPPAALPSIEALHLGVDTMDRQGTQLRVTSIERTLVDAFDRLTLSGGWEEVWRSLEGLDLFLDFALLLRYVGILKNATTNAKVGFFLESYRERLRVPLTVLEALKCQSPKQPHYVERRRRKDARLIRGWNILVPSNLEKSITPSEDAEEDIPV